MAGDGSVGLWVEGSGGGVWANPRTRSNEYKIVYQVEKSHAQARPQTAAKKYSALILNFC